MNDEKIFNEIFGDMGVLKKERTYVIFGADLKGKTVCDLLLKNDFNVSYFVDNSESKQGKELYGKKVYSPDVLRGGDY